jgi:DNA invertase Pin-like site-specific DNA recombinase
MVAPRIRPRRVLSYIRVSSDRQATRGTSLDGQREAHLAYCAAHGLPDPVFFVEVESASDLAIEKRDEQLRIQREAERGDLVLVTVLDRWSRDVPHAVGTVRTMIKHDVHVILFQDSIDASTPEGDWMLVQRAAMAEQERKRLLERTVVRRRQLADAGFYVAGHVPFGYRREKRRLFVVPEEAAIVVDVFERSASGQSLPEIAAKLPPARKRMTWNVHAVHTILRNRSVLGETKRSDGTWIATHEAIISRELWDRAQAAARERVHGGWRRFGNGQSSVRLLRGMAHCAACGRRMAVRFGSHMGEETAKTEGPRMHYYVCRGILERKGCGEGWIRAHAIDVAVSARALERLTELREELAHPPREAAPTVHRKDFAGMLARIDTQRANAVDLATSGAMSGEDLRRALARYEEQASVLRREQTKAAEEEARLLRGTDRESRSRALLDVNAIRASWEHADVEQRREVIGLLAARIEVGRAGVRFTWRSAEDLAGEWTGKAIT